MIPRYQETKRFHLDITELQLFYAFPLYNVAQGYSIMRQANSTGRTPSGDVPDCIHSAVGWEKKGRGRQGETGRNLYISDDGASSGSVHCRMR
jgi:hypothetical protein